MGSLTNLIRLKQRLFPNKAVALSVEALGWCDDVFREEVMWTDLREALLPALYKSTPKRDQMVNDDLSASRFILGLIASYSEREVSSGHYHTYRGVLGFEGQSLRNIAELALSHLHESDWLSYESYRDRLEQLDENVKSAG